MENSRRPKRCCKGCYPKRATEYFDMFAEPVYQMTFRDSYVVSTCMGCLCSGALIAALAFVLFYKTMLFIDNDPGTFQVTEGIEYGYYSIDEEFDEHSMAIGLIYRPEYQANMDTITKSTEFTSFLATLVDIQLFT